MHPMNLAFVIVIENNVTCESRFLTIQQLLIAPASLHMITVLAEQGAARLTALITSKGGKMA